MERLKIDLYISDLLYQYECVVVPDFGGFVANFAPARINTAQNKFFPPSKNISFNQNLKVNDGLLANHISGRRSISYQEALEIIKDFAKTSKEGLNAGNKVIIEKVGTLYTDQEGNVCFSPDSEVNYLKDSFGFESFKKAPISKRPIERGLKENLAKSINLAEEVNRRKSIPWKAAAAIFVGLIGGSWLAMNYQSSKNAFVNYSNLNFLSTATAKYTPLAKEVIEEKSGKEENYWVEKNDTFSELVLIKELAEKNSIIVNKLHESNEVATIAVDNTMVADKTSSQRLVYHVVGGCFSVYENAKNLYEQLSHKGYDAKMIGTYHELHTVSYSSFATRKEALAFLSKVKESENPKAWLLVK